MITGVRSQFAAVSLTRYYHCISYCVRPRPSCVARSSGPAWMCGDSGSSGGASVGRMFQYGLTGPTEVSSPVRPAPCNLAATPAVTRSDSRVSMPRSRASITSTAVCRTEAGYVRRCSFICARRACLAHPEVRCFQETRWLVFWVLLVGEVHQNLLRPSRRDI